MFAQHPAQNTGVVYTQLIHRYIKANAMIEEPNYEFALYLGVQLEKVKRISCCAQDICVPATQSVKQHRCDWMQRWLYANGWTILSTGSVMKRQRRAVQSTVTSSSGHIQEEVGVIFVNTEGVGGWWRERAVFLMHCVWTPVAALTTPPPAPTPPVPLTKHQTCLGN